MFREIVKDLYISKSKLREIRVNGKIMSSNTLVKDVALPTTFGNTLPDYGTIGTLCNIMGFGIPDNSFIFEVDPKGDHKLFITGIPKDALSLKAFKLKHTIWSSYYEDDKRGYLFQVLPYEIKRLELCQ